MWLVFGSCSDRVRTPANIFRIAAKMLRKHKQHSWRNVYRKRTDTFIVSNVCTVQFHCQSGYRSSFFHLCAPTPFVELYLFLLSRLCVYDIFPSHKVEKTGTRTMTRSFISFFYHHIVLMLFLTCFLKLVKTDTNTLTPTFQYHRANFWPILCICFILHTDSLSLEPQKNDNNKYITETNNTLCVRWLLCHTFVDAFCMLLARSVYTCIVLYKVNAFKFTSQLKKRELLVVEGTHWKYIENSSWFVTTNLVRAALW